MAFTITEVQFETFRNYTIYYRQDLGVLNIKKKKRDLSDEFRDLIIKHPIIITYIIYMIMKIL